jgi:hypothetical protein
MQTDLKQGDDAKIVEQIYFLLLEIADQGDFSDV